MLIDRSGHTVVASTDPISRTIYLVNGLNGDFYIRVLLHELGHCTMVAYGLIDEIHQIIPERYWIDVEEWICNYLADYGRLIFEIARSIMGEDL